MQIKLFTIPVSDSGKTLEEMNRFLRGNKILEVQSELVSNKNGAFWCFCIRYIENTYSDSTPGKTKIDYKNTLDETTFKKFSTLREIRKTVATEQGVPAYAVFTDEELSELAKLDSISPQTMLSIKGIGEKKTEKYAKYFLTDTNENEKGGQSH